MEYLFYLHASVMVLAMGLAMISMNTVHALLYTVLSLLNLAISLYLIKAPLAGVLEAIIYAGAIMVLFVFAVMLLRVEHSKEKPNAKNPRYVFAVLMALLFFVDVAFILRNKQTTSPSAEFSIQDIAVSLFGAHGFLLEMASFVLLAGLTTALFVGMRFITRQKADS